ncbi:cohesin domain-containing protein [Nitrosomonas sp.]|uniref:cohesin domain-containing protein n=1 Tax=Nitrosomonas sp. TaxID=42353 RepID=UPI0032EB29D5
MIKIGKIIRSLSLAAVLWLPVSSVMAVAITISPVSQTVTLGNTAVIDIGISGLGDHSSPSLGVFDLDILFDPAILGFNSVVFGDSALGDQLDLLGFGSITDVKTVSGSINLFELSLDSAADLDSMQSGEFVLARILFNSLSIGDSALQIVVNDLGDANGAAITAAVSDARITVSAIPEPDSIFLMISGLLVIFLFRKNIS